MRLTLAINSVKKSKCDSGKGSKNIRTRDCKREKYTDSTLTSPTLHSLLVTHLKKDLEKQEKALGIKRMLGSVCQLPGISEG